MSDSFSTPIVLFGDVGPDVVRITQVYDPDTDAYVKTWDTMILEGKHYFGRRFANKVVTFTDVTATLRPDDNPMELELYEDNPDKKTITTGRYVPAVKSLVVCDEAFDTYPERTVLIVESVDSDTLKSTLVPINFGTGGETSARALDYGNDRFMLYFMKNEGPGGATVSVSLTPDRKLTLYGWRYYMYRLLRGTQVISGMTPNEEVSSNGFVPYVSPTAKRQLVTPTGENAYTKFAGHSFDVLSPRGALCRCVIPSSNDAFLSTFDGVFRSGRTYYKREAVDNYRLLVAGTDYEVGDVVVGLDICQHPDQAFLGDGEGVEGWIDIDITDGRIFYPADGFLRAGVDNIRAGEPIVMETYEFMPNSTKNDMRLIMSVTLLAKETQVVDSGDVTSRKVKGFDVRVDDTVNSSESAVHRNDAGELEIGVQEPISNLADHLVPYLIYDDGSERIVPIDNRVSYVYGLENVDTTNAGTKFSVLFKYFLDEKQLSPQYQFGSNQAKGFVSCVKTVKVVDKAGAYLSKIAMFPLWNHNSGCYKFKYATYHTNGDAPAFVDDLGATIVGVRDSHLRGVKFTHGTYMDDYGVIRGATNISELFGYVIHGMLAVYATHDDYGSSVFSQGIGLRLQNWELVSNPIKWLIGTTKDEDPYSDEHLKYGSNREVLRPYITYDADNALTSDAPFQVGLKFDETAFRTAFYENIGPVDDGSKPTYFRIRSFTQATRYLPLANTLALEGVRYYDPDDGTEVPVVPGVTNVEQLVIKVQAELDYFVNNGTTEAPVWEVPSDLPAEGTKLTASQRKLYHIRRYADVASKYIELDSEHLHDKVSLDQAVSAAEVVGGAIPTQVGDFYETPVMGVVAVEFARKDGGEYFHIISVPVEVRHRYELVTGTYETGKKYYRYNASKNGFEEKTGWRPGDPIVITDGATFIKTEGD